MLESWARPISPLSALNPLLQEASGAPSVRCVGQRSRQPRWRITNSHGPGRWRSHPKEIIRPRHFPTLCCKGLKEKSSLAIAVLSSCSSKQAIQCHDYLCIYTQVYNLRRGDESQPRARIFLFPQRNVVVVV